MLGFWPVAGEPLGSQVAAATSVTGSLAQTEGTDTLIASGALTASGTLAQTDGTDTLVASGTVGSSSVSGDVNVTDSTDAIAASGTLTAIGSLALTDTTDALSATGALTAAGTLSLTDGADTLVADGTVAASSISGDLSVTDGADVLLASGTGGATVELLGGGPGGPKRTGRPEKGSYWERLLSPPLQDRLEAIEPEAAEVIEAVAQVVPVVADPAVQQAEMRRALEQAGIAYREAYVEIYAELLAEMRRQDDEDEVLLLMAA